MPPACTDGCNSVYYVLGALVVLGLLLVVILVIMRFKKQPKRGPARTEARYADQPQYGIQVVDNFLTPEECAEIKHMAGPLLFDSAVYASEKDILDPNTRISKQCWLKSHVPSVQKIRQRIRNLIPDLSPSAFLEDVQVVQYKPGGFFKPHYDACVGSSEFCQRMDHPHGPRYITVLIYLNEALTGGETVFPNINEKVVPKTGRVVIFYNVDRDQNIITQALHGGEPVQSGEKWIANQWIRIW